MNPQSTVEWLVVIAIYLAISFVLGTIVYFMYVAGKRIRAGVQKLFFPQAEK